MRKLLKIIAAQAVEIKFLKNRIKELEDLLNKNSKNSSLPPSQDIYKKFSSSEEPKSQKIGAQLGHKANFREKLEPTETVKIEIPDFCDCGGKVCKDKKSTTIQKVDIPKIVPDVTDYILERGRCVKCRKKYTAKMPQGITRDLLGPRVKSIIASLTGVYNMSKSETKGILDNLFGIKVCIGMITKTTDRVSDKCSTAYDQILKNINKSPFIHADETGFRVQTSHRRNWAWAIANNENVYFRIADNRSRKVIEELTKDFNGYVISDRYPVYNYFDESKRQVCLAHIKRDFEKFSNSKFEIVSKIGKKLSSSLGEIFMIIKASPNKNFCKSVRLSVSKHVSSIISGLEDLSCFKLSKRIHNSAKNLLKHKKMFWKFLRIPWLSPTNNHAERVIRNLVIYRKKCFSVYGEKGKDFIQKIKSIYQTSKLNNRNIHQELFYLITE